MFSLPEFTNWEDKPEYGCISYFLNVDGYTMLRSEYTNYMPQAFASQHSPCPAILPTTQQVSL